VLLVLAIVGLFLLPDPWRVILIGVALVIEVGEIFAWRRFLSRYRVQTGAEGLVGRTAEVIVACAPDGRVKLSGEIWNARCEVPMANGERVRVVSVEGLTLVVEPDD
jgi:membrane-bound serine protease (ClpP class)